MLKSRRHVAGLICAGTILLTSSACGTHAEPSWNSFNGAANVKSFPVPREANKTEQTSGNTELDYVRYALPGIKEGDDIPEPYLNEIESWGWKQRKDDSGASLVFEKGNSIVHLTVHDGYLIIMVPSQTKKQAIQGLESKK
ncbi:MULTISPECIES: hypothetical protein [Paenibacillus]|uniref:Lipoprotein n=1 Tax=Paenibacillus campinasensis TaxID=66347 RepID=A0A268EGK0_9BACL|nr:MULTISPECIES: hypothetical protein [Paenibacillus]MUG68765.1 hypothetical protein [Paenibacillus campinasensis]PAD72265.1 hypothetical protein CHH67_22720 [Paenibacillus campinasensis]PAK48731.1 hypothetical protein CHH75_21980 [Paenibacillus sp. 7541]